jgi:hypothetical protein
MPAGIERGFRPSSQPLPIAAAFSQPTPFRDGHWQPELLPHRPLLQSHVYNTKSGSMMREIQPL